MLGSWPHASARNPFNYQFNFLSTELVSVYNFTVLQAWLSQPVRLLKSFFVISKASVYIVALFL